MNGRVPPTVWVPWTVVTCSTGAVVAVRAASASAASLGRSSGTGETMRSTSAASRAGRSGRLRESLGRSPARTLFSATPSTGTRKSRNMPMPSWSVIVPVPSDLIFASPDWGASLITHAASFRADPREAAGEAGRGQG
jgi:hypothetical protein